MDQQLLEQLMDEGDEVAAQKRWPEEGGRERKRARCDDMWTCQHCGNENYPDRVRCNMRKCQKLRPGHHAFKPKDTPPGVLRIAEFYSGIGGMHAAWRASRHADKGTPVVAFDVNEVANSVYKHNHPDAVVSSEDILRLGAEDYDVIQADVWVMSPPCQPYTRQGLRKGSEDPRAWSFLSMIGELEKLKHRPKYILLENVLGFERSDTYSRLVEKLEKSKYTYQTLCINTTLLGIPNSRPRLYLLAKAQGLPFAAPEHCGKVVEDPPTLRKILGLPELSPGTLKEFFAARPQCSPKDTTPFLVPQDQIRKAGDKFDVVDMETTRTSCFTKAYGKHAQGAGSVVKGDDGALRYFAPQEVSALLGFPENFDWPKGTSMLQCFRLLGNSLSVTMVSHLLNYLLP